MCFICEIIKDHQIPFSKQPYDKNDLDEKIRKKVGKNVIYALGNEVSFSKIDKAMDDLMQRDYSSIRKIVIPNRYITKIPNVISRDPKFLEDQCKKVDDKKLASKFMCRKDNLKGDNVEHNLYDALVDVYEDTDDVLILHGYEILSFELGKSEKMEKDVVIVDGNFKFIMNIEAKHRLDQKSVHDAKRQLENTKELAQKWLGNVIDSSWTFISALYSDGQPVEPKQKSGKVTFLQCNPNFVLVGAEDLQRKIQHFRNPRFRQEKDDTFFQIAKHLIYFATATPAPTINTIHEKEAKGIDTCGTQESITFWNWNPDQNNLIESGQKRVIFDSGFGTGKTRMMVTMAKKIAKEKKEKVIYIIYAEDIKGFLLLDTWLAQEFKGIEEIEVFCHYTLSFAKNKMANFFCDIKDSHLFIDEVKFSESAGFVLNEILEVFKDRPDLYLWITIGYTNASGSYSSYWKSLPVGHLPESYKEWLADKITNFQFHVPNLKIILRNSKQVILKRNEMMADPRISFSLARGEILCRRKAMLAAHNNFIEGEAVSFRITDVSALTETMSSFPPNGILVACNNEHDKFSTFEVKKLWESHGRKGFIGMREDDILQWLENGKNKIDLLVDFTQTLGFEWPFVVFFLAPCGENLSIKPFQVENVIMRAKSKIVIIQDRKCPQNMLRTIFGAVKDLLIFTFTFLPLLVLIWFLISPQGFLEYLSSPTFYFSDLLSNVFKSLFPETFESFHIEFYYNYLKSIITYPLSKIKFNLNLLKNSFLNVHSHILESNFGFLKSLFD